LKSVFNILIYPIIIITLIPCAVYTECCDEQIDFVLTKTFDNAEENCQGECPPLNQCKNCFVFSEIVLANYITAIPHIENYLIASINKPTFHYANLIWQPPKVS